MRVFSISDVHSDFSENNAWLKQLVQRDEHKEDVLIVAGDVSERLPTFVSTMRDFKTCFGHVFFVPGNHDLWVEKDTEGRSVEGGNSLDKLKELEKICDEIGVCTKPKLINDAVWIVPLLSWYHKSFDCEPDVTHIKLPQVEAMASDFRRCIFPPHLPHFSEELARHFDGMNSDMPDRQEHHKMITFSHFIPRQDLLPEKRFLFYPHLPKMSGSRFLHERICALKPDIHVFGHTHIAWDSVCDDGVRYIQGPLAYPGERSSGMNGGPNFTPFLLYDDRLDGDESSQGPFAPQQPCRWSDLYRARERDPSNTVDLAPYVLARWK